MAKLDQPSCTTFRFRGSELGEFHIVCGCDCLQSDRIHNSAQDSYVPAHSENLVVFFVWPPSSRGFACNHRFSAPLAFPNSDSARRPKLPKHFCEQKHVLSPGDSTRQSTLCHELLVQTRIRITNPHVQQGGGYKSFSMSCEFLHPSIQSTLLTHNPPVPETHSPLSLPFPWITTAIMRSKPSTMQSITS